MMGTVVTTKERAAVIAMRGIREKESFIPFQALRADGAILLVI